VDDLWMWQRSAGDRCLLTRRRLGDSTAQLAYLRREAIPDNLCRAPLRVGMAGSPRPRNPIARICHQYLDVRRIRGPGAPVVAASRPRTVRAVVELAANDHRETRLLIDGQQLRHRLGVGINFYF